MDSKHMSLQEHCQKWLAHVKGVIETHMKELYSTYTLRRAWHTRAKNATNTIVHTCPHSHCTPDSAARDALDVMIITTGSTAYCKGDTCFTYCKITLHFCKYKRVLSQETHLPGRLDAQLETGVPAGVAGAGCAEANCKGRHANDRCRNAKAKGNLYYQQPRDMLEMCRDLDIWPNVIFLT